MLHTANCSKDRLCHKPLVCKSAAQLMSCKAGWPPGEMSCKECCWQGWQSANGLPDGLDTSQHCSQLHMRLPPPPFAHWMSRIWPRTGTSRVQISHSTARQSMDRHGV